jgi:ABC-2 type transport system ATP-binding protein
MIRVQGLTKYYGNTRAIEDISFEINQGETIGFLGLNGAGKTTLLRILSCLLLPSSGQVTINGLDIITHSYEIRKKIGFLPEDLPLYDEMTVKSYLEFVGRLKGLNKSQLQERYKIVEEKTNIKEVKDEIVGNLSYGYRKRLGIAQTIIHNPPILIFDEPISGLDPAQIVEIREMIKSLKGAHIILISSHILSEISQTCDRIFVIQQGKIIAEGREEELANKLVGRQKIEIEVQGEKQKLLNLLDIHRDINQYQLVSEENNIIRLNLELNSDVRANLSRTLIENGFELLKLTRTDIELESIFLKLTKPAA